MIHRSGKQGTGVRPENSPQLEQESTDLDHKY